MGDWVDRDDFTFSKNSTLASGVRADFGIGGCSDKDLAPSKNARAQDFFPSSTHSRKPISATSIRPILADRKLPSASPNRVPIVPGMSLSTNSGHRPPVAAPAPAPAPAPEYGQGGCSILSSLSALEIPSGESSRASQSPLAADNRTNGSLLSSIKSTKVYGSIAKKAVLAFQAPLLPVATRRSSRTTAKSKSSPVTIDLLDSDDDENESKNRDSERNPLLTSIAAKYASPLSPFITNDGAISKVKPQLTVHTCQATVSPAFQAECVSIGLLVYHYNNNNNNNNNNSSNSSGGGSSSGLCSVQISSVGPRVTYSLTATGPHGVRGDCQIDDEYVDGPFTGTLDSSPDVGFIGMTAREGLRLKSVAVGPGRVLSTQPLRKGSRENNSGSPYIFIFLPKSELQAFSDTLTRLPRGQKKSPGIPPARSTMSREANRVWDTRHEDGPTLLELFDRADVEKTDERLSERDTSFNASASTRSSRRTRTRARDDIDYNDPVLRQTFLVYPPEPEATDAVTLCRGDLQRLQPGVYYNDNLIDLRIKLLLMDLSDEKRKKIHAFSCHFYSKMTERGMAVAKEAHELVARWTKNVQLFEMDFVLFPINLHKHWSLAVLVRPGLLWSTEGVLSVLERRKAGAEKDDLQDTPLSTPEESPREAESEEACLLFLDSLSMHPYTKICRGLASYLYYERQVRREERGLEREDVTEAQFVSALSVVKGQAPRQQNSYDCGVYATRFADMVMTVWPSSRPADLASKFGDQFLNRFSQTDIDDERVAFSELVHKHHEKWKELRRVLGQDGEVESQVDSHTSSTEEGAAKDESNGLEDGSMSTQEPSRMATSDTVEEAEVDNEDEEEGSMETDAAGGRGSSATCRGDSSRLSDGLFPACDVLPSEQGAASAQPVSGRSIGIHSDKKRKAETMDEVKRPSWRSVIESRVDASLGLSSGSSPDAARDIARNG